MNINSYPSSQITLNKSIIPDPSLNNGTHYSHAGIGGYIEVPTLKDMYDIPSISNDLNNTIDPNGLTSGKRKLGMIVYVLENNKYYQLKPRYKDTTRVIPWPVLSGIPDLFRGFLMNPSRISYLDDSTNSIVWSNIEQLTGKNNITSDDVNSLKKYGYYTDPGDPLSIQDAVLVGTGDSSVPIDPTYGIPTDDLAWTEVFVKGNFANIGDLNLYATGNAAAYAGQICSTLDTNSVYVLDSGLSPLAIGGGGGDDLLNDDLTVLGVSIGSYSDGQTITKDTSLEAIIKNMLQKRIPPTYDQPVFSISTNIASTYEIGTFISPTIMGNWTQNNAGSLVAYNIYKNSSLVSGPSSSIPLTHFTDSSFAISSNVVYNATAEWSDGDILDDNMSDPYPAGRILNNASNPKVSNVITFTPKRAVFYTADTATSAPTESSQIRLFTSRIDIGNGSTFTISISTAVKRIVVAYLASYGPITSVIDSKSKYDVQGAFGQPVSMPILGANGYAGETYYVYTCILGNSYSSPVTYTVTI